MPAKTDVDVIGFLTKVKNQPGADQEMMRRNGFIIDNLNDRWQKLAFTLYTDIVALSSEAEQILQCLAEEGEDGN
jgi:hypothetical protein